MEKSAIIIPARLESQRLPRKPLKLLGDKPIVVHVYERVLQCSGVDMVVIATDSEELVRVAGEYGIRCLMTSDQHQSGTDRVAEAARELEVEWVVNVQGDEPFIDPDDVQRVLDQLKTGRFDLTTLRYPIENVEDLNNSNVVKVVCGEEGRALYFSRSPIPYYRDAHFQAGQCFRHVGIYGYRNAVLQALTVMPPHPLETAEKLEQLRALAHGKSIGVFDALSPSRGIDTEEDFQWAQSHWQKLKV